MVCQRRCIHPCGEEAYHHFGTGVEYVLTGPSDGGAFEVGSPNWYDQSNLEGRYWLIRARGMCLFHRRFRPFPPEGADNLRSPGVYQAFFPSCTILPHYLDREGVPGCPPTARARELPAYL
jgi:hypothetical protein